VEYYNILTGSAARTFRVFSAAKTTEMSTNILCVGGANSHEPDTKITFPMAAPFALVCEHYPPIKGDYYEEHLIYDKRCQIGTRGRME